jgi:uncharacterized SAM-binding protein YcdF (DUF218 family)
LGPVIRRLLLIVVALVGLWLVACAFLFVWPRADAPPPHADAVVVLSGGLDRRLDPALALVRAGVAPVLAISSPTRGPWPQARALCSGATKLAGVRVICFQPSPFSTQGEARTVARLAHSRGWHRVVVVTSTFHVTRARMLFERCYHDKLWVVGSSWPWWKLPEEWASETGKLAVQLTAQRGC